jgi:hypothetical protein
MQEAQQALAAFQKLIETNRLRSAKASKWKNPDWLVRSDPRRVPYLLVSKDDRHDGQINFSSTAVW